MVDSNEPGPINDFALFFLGLILLLPYPLVQFSNHSFPTLAWIIFAIACIWIIYFLYLKINGESLAKELLGELGKEKRRKQDYLRKIRTQSDATAEIEGILNDPVLVISSETADDDYIAGLKHYKNEYYFEEDARQKKPPRKSKLKLVDGYITNVVNGVNYHEDAKILVDKRDSDRGWVSRSTIARVYGW